MGKKILKISGLLSLYLHGTDLKLENSNLNTVTAAFVLK